MKIIDTEIAELLAQGIHSTVETSDDAIIGKDLDGTIISWNSGAERLFGYKAQEAIGRSVAMLIPESRRDEEPEILARLRRGERIDHLETARCRKDGSLVDISLSVSPITNDRGIVVGAWEVARDISERNRAETLAQRLGAIVESSDDAIVSKDLNGIIASWNGGAERLFGYTAREAVGRAVAMLIPEERHDEEPEILARLRRGERIDHYETVRRRKDGSLVDVSLSVSPIRNAHGVVIGAAKIARDISDRRKAQERQQLLVREMSHRVNNLFAIARSIVSLTARSAATPKDMARAVVGRLDALASAHNLARPDSHEPETNRRAGTTLDALIRVIAAPYDTSAQDHGQAAVVAKGPEIFVGAEAISAMSLVLHELATNAAKYGALSIDEGCVQIKWAVKKDRLVLQWKESGGPPICSPPEKVGFGTLLVRRTIADQLGGALRYEWNAPGLEIELVVPLESLAPSSKSAAG